MAALDPAKDFQDDGGTPAFRARQISVAPKRKVSRGRVIGRWICAPLWVAIQLFLISQALPLVYPVPEFYGLLALFVVGYTPIAIIGSAIANRGIPADRMRDENGATYPRRNVALFLAIPWWLDVALLLAYFPAAFIWHFPLEVFPSLMLFIIGYFPVLMLAAWIGKWPHAEIGATSTNSRGFPRRLRSLLRRL